MADADEVSVSDVLCRAMEYLTKLGSNLRSRSESLKEKRICKNKLKNAHAVQRAAEKVLMICKLSKKSLENVENTVKKVVSDVHAEQQPQGDGGKQSSDKVASSSNRKSTENASRSTFSVHTEMKKDLTSPRKIYVSGKPYSLKFPRKISVKHYMSVKVLAKSLPKTMLEKYPVYHDCKLYRRRHRELVRRSRESIETKKVKDFDNDTDVRASIDDSTTKGKEKSQKSANVSDVEEALSQCSDELEAKGSNNQTDNQINEHSHISFPLDQFEAHENENSETLLENNKQVFLEMPIHSETSKDHLESPSKKKERSDSMSKEYKSDSKSKKHSESKKSDHNDSKKDKKKAKEPEKKESRKDSEDSGKTTKKFRKIKMFDDSSDSETEKQSKNEAEKPSKKSNEMDVASGSDKEVTAINNESIIDLDDSDKELDKPDEISKEKESKEISPKLDPGLDSKEDDKKLSDSSTTEPTKPLIKCVSLTKLLKPDVLNKAGEKLASSINANNAKAKSQNSKLIVHMTTKGEIKSKFMASKTDSDESNYEDTTTKKVVKRVRYQDEEDFWSAKRQEVKHFKPKNFHISITRLPKFNESFLEKYNLKRITKLGAILCEASAVNADSEVNSNGINEKSESRTTEAKNALLNDSDAESSIHLTYESEENIKNSLLDDSESDPKNKRLKNSHMDKNGKSHSNEAQNVKKSLLADSDSDKREDEDIPKIRKKSDSSKAQETSTADTYVSQKSKPTGEQQDKDLTEAQNVKKSLLVDSDSDKREDQETTQMEADSNIQEKSNTDLEVQSKETDMQDKELAKSSLLNESSDSNSKSQSKKRKRRESSSKSPRKHIMESMHAKKMLLTYSSSSDTEDEQLKSVIKDIKDELMKSIEETEDVTKSLKKKVQSSSDSDEDILARLNKRKKVQDSPKKDNESEKTSQDETNSHEKEISNASGSESSSPDKLMSKSAKMGRSRGKSGGSCSPNSDSQEDKNIEGLTNLETLTKRRRRRESSSDSPPRKPITRRRRRMAKASQLFEEEELLAPESSDDASAGDSDGPEEELPTVSLSDLNGGGIEHLAKDDLLEESESDTSKDKSSDAKKDDDSDSETVKAKRRKAQAISSDSEAGSSRRKKDADVKISDFEDSEDESSEPVKRSKRKKKSSDSDASAGSSSDGKKKRKRIKQIDSDDDGSGSDTENEGKNKHGRKNIRKVMGKNQLEEATKKAAREEKERLARIVERQKMYNNLEFDESGKPDEVILDKVVLDFDPETKEPLIEVDRGLVKKLKPHQANGIKFMWDACFESVKRIKKDKGSGCILAHCMGLGKTLQVVSLTHTLLTHSELTRVSRVLVVCPLSTVLNWVNEFNMWLKHARADYEVDVYELSKYKQNSERAFQLSQWLCHGGVCVLGYEMFRNLSADNPKKFKKKMLRQFQEALVDPGPDLVVCDEGHLLKNEKTSLSQSMNRIKTRRRIVLTGTPLQNNLKEYYCMVQFVKPNLLGKYNEYLNRFVNPITNGQYTDSTEHDIKIMKRRSHVLHKMLDGAVQRRDYGVLAPFLPPKHEYVLFITLTDVQVKLYQHYLDNYSRRPLPGKSSGFLFPDFQSLQRIWTHPLVLKYNSERYEIMQQKKREREEEDSEGSLVDFIDDDSTPEESSTEESTDDLSDLSDDSRKKSKKKKSAKKSKTKDNKLSSRRATRANPVELEDEEQADPDIMEVKNDNPTEWWIPLVTDAEIEDMRNSHKLVLLFDILRQCEAIGDKLLVFSQSLYSLDLIEHFLGKVDEATQEGRVDEKLGGHVGSWSPGVDYFRLDGSTSCENRSIWCKNFNREDNPRARLFLISTRAGGLGINLVAANRVVIFDVSWNPSHDVQSIFRVYRFGQKKPCYIYRFLAMGTMEEKIYERQVTKQAISKRVIDEQQIDRHYAENDLAELYQFSPRPPAPRPVPLVPKDRLFAEMIKEHEAVIYKFHEHDSLLENKEEETLSEEERKAAWDDFENEKNRPPPQPFSAWPMHNGMPNMNLMAQQQQQLAYAALAGMLRKDMPGLTDDNIRAMLPLLYSSNPGLMQKLSEMYKYAQPGMMNPQMMNMNMSAGGMGVGGSSGLQYEPPWQRQQQQQQQHRLQQLLQHQQGVNNSMGAKLYAGGLGSRDPVAMALQQQRAREIMFAGGGGGGGGVGGGGTGAGRPRGRPPLQPRVPPPVPPHATGDVVNLDSD